MEPAAAQQLASPQQWWQYGVLGIGILVFGIVITILAKEYKKVVKDSAREREAMAAERTAWAIERAGWAMEKERIAAEFNRQHNVLLVEYAKKVDEENRTHAKALVDAHKECQEREDSIRDDYDELTKLRSDEQKKTMDALADALEKLGGKLTPRRY